MNSLARCATHSTPTACPTTPRSATAVLWVDEGSGYRGSSADDLRHRTAAIAAALTAVGVRPGSVVGVAARRSVDVFAVFLALVDLHAIAVPLDPDVADDEAAEYLRFVGVVGVVVDDSDRTVPGTACEGFVLALAEIDRFAVRGTTRTRRRRRRRRRAPAPDVSLLVPYPDGHRAGVLAFGLSELREAREPFRLDRGRARGERLLLALPRSHPALISYLLAAVEEGLPTVIVDGSDDEGVLAAMAAHRPTTVVAVSRVFAVIAEDPRSAEAASTVHTWTCTGDRVHRVHVRKLAGLGRSPHRNRVGSQVIDHLGGTRSGAGAFCRVVDDVISTVDGPLDRGVVEDAVLEGCPDVTDCVVIGLPDRVGAVRPVAVVTIRPATTTSAVQLHTMADKALAGTGQPHLHAIHIADRDQYPLVTSARGLRRHLGRLLIERPAGLRSGFVRLPAPSPRHDRPPHHRRTPLHGS